jgi:two-component system chemotaxis response regulator CheY
MMPEQRDSLPKRPRLLVVDDVPAMRHFLLLVLGGLQRGITIDQAADGIQALRLAMENPYSLILLDLNLPLLDGMKVLATLRRSDCPSARTPVMIVSTVHDAETLRRARELGVTHFLPKPVQAATLLEAAREVIGMAGARAPVEERRHRRRMSIPVRLRFAGVDAIDASTWDISPEGAFVDSDRLMPIGTCATAELLVPHLDRRLTVDCEVIHVRPVSLGRHPAGFGLRFCNVTLEMAQVSR